MLFLLWLPDPRFPLVAVEKQSQIQQFVFLIYLLVQKAIYPTININSGPNQCGEIQRVN